MTRRTDWQRTQDRAQVECIIDAALAKGEKFRRNHNGMSWIEHEIAPRVTGAGNVIPDGEGCPFDA